MRLPGALIAFAIAASASPAAAAEIAQVATAGEARNSFDIDLSVRWERLQERATILRENAPDELRFVRTRHALVPRIAIGLWNDLELHAQLPYVFADDRSWRFGTVAGRPTGGVPGSSSTIENNGIDANGQPCASVPCPLFAVGSETTVYHGGRVGDLEVGLAWAIFNDRKDDTKPTWIVGTDVTFPTAARYDPAKDRDPGSWNSPNTLPATPAPFGEKVWKWDIYTVLSRRMGAIDPYVKAHLTRMFESSSTYSNCDHAAELEAATPAQANSRAVENCAAFGDESGAKLPWIAGLTLGTELVPYEDRRQSQRVSIDLRLFGDYTSPQRFYNELTDATGRIHMTDGYLTVGGLAGLYLRASEHISLQATASLATRTAHYLTGESLGRNDGWPPLGANGITADPAEMNPNFDWRYDAPGRRFHVSEVTLFEIAVGGRLQF